jgi:hypothetical protein
MERSEQELFARARRAYEIGRLRSAAFVLVYVAPMVALALVGGGGAIAFTVGIGLALAMLATGLLWRGQAWGRAVGPGLLAGVMPLVAPLVLRVSGHCCTAGGCSSLCLPVCTSAGLFAGLAVGFCVAGEREKRLDFALSAIAIAALTGALGCVGMGLGAVSGMAAALALGSAPVAALRIRLRNG